MTPSDRGAFMTSAPTALRRTHDLSELGLSAQAACMAQQDKPRRALGYGGQGSV
jgi:hypothetical protein